MTLNRPASLTPALSPPGRGRRGCRCGDRASQGLTGEVTERIAFRGRVLRPLDEATLRDTVRELAAQKVESIAVCLLFSFLHPEHEARVREIILDEMPGASISLSSEIMPQI